MNTYIRLAAAVIVAVIAIGGALYLVGPRGGVGGASPTPAPTASNGVAKTLGPTAPTPVVIPALSEIFVSPLHGYTLRHPAGWTVLPASKPWVGAGLKWGNPALDDLRGADIRLVGASQALTAGQTADQWIADKAGGGSACQGASALPTAVAVGTAIGTVTLNGCAALGGITAGGVVYDVLVVVENRGYDFTVDGIVDAAYVQALLKTVTFQPTLAVNPSPAPS